MEPELLKKIEENNELIKESLELSKDNAKKLKKINAYMRRTFIARIMYWLLIIAVTAGALYAVRPYVKKTIEAYNTIQNKVGTTTDILDNPGKLFKDVGILNQLFEIFSEKDIIAPESQ
jgi:hypothetical protein